MPHVQGTISYSELEQFDPQIEDQVFAVRKLTLLSKLYYNDVEVRYAQMDTENAPFNAENLPDYARCFQKSVKVHCDWFFFVPTFTQYIYNCNLMLVSFLGKNDKEEEESEVPSPATTKAMKARSEGSSSN